MHLHKGARQHLDLTEMGTDTQERECTSKTATINKTKFTLDTLHLLIINNFEEQIKQAL